MLQDENFEQESSHLNVLHASQAILGIQQPMNELLLLALQTSILTSELDMTEILLEMAAMQDQP